ncbi:hypothetical protein BKA69DRAFT_1123140 [Paraphysoderma sedebokerense]|nr:hypothetical protein BKA69DRAFT_1123140 [Paraphysoderma sedebokerense]
MLNPLLLYFLLALLSSGAICVPRSLTKIQKRSPSDLCPEEPNTIEQKLCKLQTDYEGYTHVGWHGTCSNYKSSIESRIQISTDPLGGLFLGPMFYVADSAAIANGYGTGTCMSLIQTLFDKKTMKPTLCSIYAKTDVLASTPKIYVPKMYPLSPDELPDDATFLKKENKLWQDYQNLDEWEALILSGGRPPTERTKLPAAIRISEHFPSRIQFQAAFPASFIPHLQVKCEILDYTVPIEVLEELRQPKYMQLPDQRAAPWGEILGAQYYTAN